MATVIELTRILRCSQESQQELWRQNASLMAYHVILSALDSNDEEVRETAGRILTRSSPRPQNYGKEARRA